MKKLIFIVFIIIGHLNLNVLGQPKYISYESLDIGEQLTAAEKTKLALDHAFKLARHLDGGKWYGQLIRSTIVLNYNDYEYYILATLGNGKSEKLYIDKLIKASESNNLILKNNRFLIFPNKSNAQYEIFDQSEFYNIGLTANYYKKSYPIGHPLEGKEIYYQLKRLNSIKNNYELELVNGVNIRLNFYSSYDSLKNNKLVANFNNLVGPVFSNMNWITSVKGFSKIPYQIPTVEDENTKVFGIHLTFEQPINYTSEDIAILINRTNKGSFIDFVIPNSTPLRNVSIDNSANLEYISNFRLLNNSKEGYSTLRANFFNENIDNVDFLWDQPNVYIHPDKYNVFFAFYHDTLQIINYGNYNWSESQILTEQRLLSQTIKPLTSNLSSTFVKNYNGAVIQYNEALKLTNWQEWIQKFNEISEKFNKVGTYAINKDQLQLALKGRNLSIDHVFNGKLVSEIYPIMNQSNFSKNRSILGLLTDLNFYTRAHAAKDAFINDVKLLYTIDQKLYLMSNAVKKFNRNDDDEISRFKRILKNQRNSLNTIKSTNSEVVNIKNNLMQLASNIEDIIIEQ